MFDSAFNSTTGPGYVFSYGLQWDIGEGTGGYPAREGGDGYSSQVIRVPYAYDTDHEGACACGNDLAIGDNHD